MGVVVRHPARAPVAALAVAAAAERLQPARMPLTAIRMHRTSHAVTDDMTPPLGPTDRSR